MKTLLLSLLATALLWQTVLARDRSMLEAELVQGAKTEKKLVIYATVDLPQTMQVLDEFVQKYPFLDLEFHPLETEALVARVQNESRTGTAPCDVLIGGGDLFQPLFKENALASYHSLERDALTEALIDNQGYWSGYYINAYVLGYNTTLVNKEDIPRSYSDLLDPRWQGDRIAIDTTAHGLLRGLLAIWGEHKTLAYLTRLAAQHPLIARANISAVNAVHNGTVSLVLARAPLIQGYKDKKQSPIDWIALEPTIAQIDAVMLPARSSHPNAARLFVNFALSREGQGALASVQQIPVRRDTEAHSQPGAPGHIWFVKGRINTSTFKQRQDCFGRSSGSSDHLYSKSGILCVTDENVGVPVRETLSIHERKEIGSLLLIERRERAIRRSQ